MIEESSKVIEILNTGYIICLILGILFFVISVILFIFFDIKTVFLVRTGKSAKREIKKLEEKNFNTGKINRHKAYEDSGSFGKSEEMDKTELIGENKTEVLEEDSTTVLNENDSRTTVLNIGTTTVLNTGMQGAAIYNRKFNIIKKEILIHTKEVI